MHYDVYLPYLTIIIDDGLGFTIEVFRWLLPEDHYVYKTYKRSMQNITVSNLIKTCLKFNICQGIQINEISGSIITQSILKFRKSLDSIANDEKALIPYNALIFHRTRDCEVLVYHEDSNLVLQCHQCKHFKICTKRKKTYK